MPFQPTTDRYRLGDIDNAQFYMIPKSLIDSKKYQDLSIPAKVVYGLLLDRMHLSRKNGWINNRGEIYLVFSQNKLATKLSKSKASVNNYMAELKKFGLIDMVYQKSKEKGNLPALIYIKKLPMLTDEEAMELKDEILIDTTTLSEILELPGIINSPDIPPGQYTDHPSQYTDHPGQYTDHPSQYTEQPSQYTDHPSQYTEPSNTEYNNTDYSKTEKVIKIDDDEDDDRAAPEENVDNFQSRSSDPDPVIRNLIKDYAKEIREMSRGVHDLTTKQAEYTASLIRKYSPEIFSEALMSALAHQNLKIAYIESIMQAIASPTVTPIKKQSKANRATNSNQLMTSRNATNDEMLEQCLAETMSILGNG